MPPRRMADYISRRFCRRYGGVISTRFILPRACADGCAIRIEAAASLADISHLFARLSRASSLLGRRFDAAYMALPSPMRGLSTGPLKRDIWATASFLAGWRIADGA